MNSKKNNIIFFSVLGVCAVLLTAAALFFGMRFQAAAIAKARVEKEIQELKTENENLENKRAILRDKVNSKDAETSKKDELNQKIKEISAEIENLSSEITQKTNEITELRYNSSALSEEVNALVDGMDEKDGDTTSFKDATVSCPGDLAAGRYKATGDGSLVINTVNHTARISEDLNTIETGSYIFEIEDGETVDIKGTVKISRLT